MNSDKHLDELLRDWTFDPQNLSVRLVKGDDGRDVVQVRVDLGILQLETEGRPDGTLPFGAKTVLDALRLAASENDDFEMSEEQCFEADREFVQFYHRRVAWLRLQHYRRAIQDANHTLNLMDMCRDHAADEEWTMSHEQYRPFVLFQRTQAAALAALDEEGPEQAVLAISDGLNAIRDVFAEHDCEDQFESDEMVERLIDLRKSLRKEYEVGPTLQERLAEAVALEEYELAARLRDELAKQQTKS